MPKILVVTVTHNGGQKLKNLITSMWEKKPGMRHDTLIIDSASDNQEDIRYIDSMRNKNIMVLRKDESRYDTGGYLHAWRNTKGVYDYYLFLHDDCVIMEDDWLKRIYEKHRDKYRDKLGVVALAEVHGNWHEGQLTYVRRNTGMEPDINIPYPMGPIFFISKEAMVKVEEAGYLKPEHEPMQKVEVEAWEISWGHIFHKTGIGFDSLMGPHPGAVWPDHYKEGHIIKHDISLRT